MIIVVAVGLALAIQAWVVKPYRIPSGSMEPTLAIGQRVLIDTREETQSTPLMYFARQGKPEPVQWLLAHGADRNARNKRGKTAAEMGRRHAGIVRLLAR